MNFLNDTRLTAAMRLFLYNGSASIGTIIGVIAIVFLVGVQIATLFGVIDISSNVIRHSGVDFWVVTKNTVNLDHSGDLPVNYIDRLNGLEEVDFARPLVNSAGLLRDKSGRFELAIVFGIKPPHMTGGPWNFKKGNESALLEPFGMTIDDTTLEYKYYPEIGQLMDIQDRKLRVLAYTNHFRTFRGDASYMSAFNAKRINNTSQLLVNAIMVKLKGGVDREEAKKKIVALFPFASVIETEDLAKSTVNYNLETTGVGGSLYLSAGLAAGIGIVIIALTLYNSILSYERDIAIFRALGARKIDILIIILYQVLIMALIGIFLGLILLSLALNIISETRVPVALPIWFGPVHILTTLLVCILGSLYAVRHAMKVEPVTVFR